MRTLGGMVEIALGIPGLRAIRADAQLPKRKDVFPAFRARVLAIRRPFTSADLIDFCGYDPNTARVYLRRMADRREITDTGERRPSPTGNSKRLIVYQVAEITGIAQSLDNGNIQPTEAHGN